jgi:hypothetical protein
LWRGRNFKLRTGRFGEGATKNLRIGVDPRLGEIDNVFLGILAALEAIRQPADRM